MVWPVPTEPEPPEAMNLVDPIALHEAALDATAAIVARLGPNQLSLPTPCAEWDVRQLVEHLVDGNEIFTRAVTGGTVEPSPADPIDAYARSTEAVRQAWREPGVASRGPRMPFAAEVACGSDAPIHDRLVAFLGRRP